MSRTSWPRAWMDATRRCLVSTPRWSEPMAIFMAGTSWRAGRAAGPSTFQDLGQPLPQALPDLLGTFLVQLLRPADRVGDVVAGGREQLRLGADSHAQALQHAQVVVRHREQVVGA